MFRHVHRIFRAYLGDLWEPLREGFNGTFLQGGPRKDELTLSVAVEEGILARLCCEGSGRFGAGPELPQYFEHAFRQRLILQH